MTFIWINIPAGRSCSMYNKLFALLAALFFYPAFLLAQQPSRAPGSVGSPSNPCFTSVNSASMTATMVPAAPPYDLAVTVSGTECPAVDYDVSECKCVCAIELTFTGESPIDRVPPVAGGGIPNYVMTAAFIDGGITHVISPNHMQFYPNDHALVIYVDGGITNATIHVKFNLPVGPSATVSGGTGLCIIDNIDHPMGPLQAIQSVFAPYLGLTRPIRIER